MQALDPKQLQELMAKFLQDIGAAASAPLVLVGDKLGFYKTLSQQGPMDPEELAKATGTAERYVREWLANQAAGGYVQYDPTTKKYSMSPEQTLALAEENSPFFIPGAFQCVAAMFQAEPKLAENFKTGKGMGWGEHDHRLFVGTERFFRPNYLGHLIGEWIPALTGVKAKLESGAKVADVGCGLGSSTILLAKSFPKSEFYGFDFHAPSIALAQGRAQEAGVADRIHFAVAKSTDYPGKDYDLVAHFDCLHDMGDPAGAARHVRQSLKADGSWMIVEPYASDQVENNLNPIGRIFYAASTSVCVPASLAQDGIALGAQAGQKQIREILTGAGFKNFRVAAQSPFNFIFEAKL